MFLDPMFFGMEVWPIDQPANFAALLPAVEIQADGVPIVAPERKRALELLLTGEHVRVGVVVAGEGREKARTVALRQVGRDDVPAGGGVVRDPVDVGVGGAGGHAFAPRVDPEEGARD